MSVCLVLIGVTLACRAPGPERPTRIETAAAPADVWVAEDKLRHLGVSFAVTTMGYAGARVAMDRAPSRIAAGAVAGAVATGKEWWDLRDYGLFSVKDLAWDAVGIALGLALANQIR